MDKPSSTEAKIVRSFLVLSLLSYTSIFSNAIRVLVAWMTRAVRNEQAVPQSIVKGTAIRTDGPKKRRDDPGRHVDDGSREGDDNRARKNGHEDRSEDHRGHADDDDSNRHDHEDEADRGDLRAAGRHIRDSNADGTARSLENRHHGGHPTALDGPRGSDRFIDIRHGVLGR
ncbi:hypothetical protein Trydic_g1415 [Trypoxylus dichotomus]